MIKQLVALVTIASAAMLSIATVTSSLAIRVFSVFFTGLLLVTPALAQHSVQQTAEDALRHRAMAQAHSAAVRCIEDKKEIATCLAELKSSCAGLGIGQYCGLKQDAWLAPAKSLSLTAHAHQAAAQCLESGKPHEDCLWDLQTACKGLAIGKYCGMVHAHTF